MSYYDVNPPWVMGASLHTVRGMGGSLHTVFGMGNPPLGFLPTQLAGLVGWWDASQIAGISSGASLSAWTDLSGNGNHLAQSTATLQPQFLTNQQNGLSAVSFNGLGQRILISGSFSSSLVQPYVLIGVYSLSTGTTAQQNFVNDSGNNGIIFGSNIVKVGSATTIDMASPTALSSGITVSDRQWFVASASFKTNASGIFVNGSGVTGNTGTANAGQGFTLGARQNGIVPANGEIGEVMIYGPLTDAQRKQVESYLTTKWGI